MLARSVFLKLCLWSLSLTGLPAFAAPMAIPQLIEPVNDQARIMRAETRAQLNRILSQVWEQGGSQIAVLTVPRLVNDSLESYAIRVVDHWQLGSANDDNGVLLLISHEDRQIRIEVGRGLEGVLPDIYASRIIRNQMSPLFQQGDFDRGMMVGIAAIIGFTDPDFSMQALASARRPQRSQDGALLLWLILMPILMTLSLIGRAKSSRQRYMGRTGYWGGIGPMSGGFRSGGGFGSGGFGGFRGGGGGFGGGGASGGW